MIVKNLVFVTLIITISTLLIPVSFSYADVIHRDSGKINNLAIEKDTAYFFEIDESIRDPGWIPDTNVYVHDDSGTRLVSDVLFAFPMELVQHGDHLYFSKLSDSCFGNVTCDYQDLVRMSKMDGSFDVIAHDLKSAIRLSVEDNGIYVSESNGNIWLFNHDDSSSPKLLYEGKNIIIMDIMSEADGTVYWIEEIEDQNNSILKMEQGSKPEIIKENLMIPYDLKDDFGQFWNEIYIASDGSSAGEFTRITEHTNSGNTIVGNFKNTNPFSQIQSGSHYGPYLVVGDYLLFSNNTGSDSTIQMQNTMTEQSYDLQTVDYKVEFMRAESDSLYVVGSNQDGFLIEKITLPVSVPEFSVLTIIVLAAGMFLAVAGFRRFPILKQSY